MLFNLAPLREHPRRFFDTAVRLSEPDNEGQVTEAWMQEASDLVKFSCIFEAMDVEHRCHHQRGPREVLQLRHYAVVVCQGGYGH